MTTAGEALDGTVMTVAGPIRPGELGPTMMHEHVFMDASGRWNEGDSDVPDAGSRRFEASFNARARWASHVLRDNLALDPVQDYDVMQAEVKAFADQAGPGGCLVDLTSGGIHPDPARLRSLVEATGVQIVTGAGFYVCSTHPEWVETATIDELAGFIRHEVEVGRCGTDVRAGIIGEIGTSETLQPCEERVLVAAAQVASTSGLTLNIHCHPGERQVTHGIIDIVEQAGADLSRCYLSHLDEIADEDYVRSVLDRGCVVGFDSFGQEGYFGPGWAARTDLDKARTLSRLAAEGYADQLVVAQDVCKKQHLETFGGLGYGHVLQRVVPRMQQLGLLDDDLRQRILVDTPRRLLTRAGSR